MAVLAAEGVGVGVGVGVGLIIGGVLVAVLVEVGVVEAMGVLVLVGVAVAFVVCGVVVLEAPGVGVGAGVGAVSRGGAGSTMVRVSCGGAGQSGSWSCGMQPAGHIPPAERLSGCARALASVEVTVGVVEAFWPVSDSEASKIDVGEQALAIPSNCWSKPSYCPLSKGLRSLIEALMWDKVSASIIPVIGKFSCSWKVFTAFSVSLPKYFVGSISVFP